MQATLHPPALRPPTHMDRDTDKTFWDAHGRVGLVWSNPNASDDVLIAAALLRRPNFHLLLDIAAHFGLDRLKCRWEGLQAGIRAREYPGNSNNSTGPAPSWSAV